MKVLNLTQHLATPDQIAAGVFEPPPETKAEIARLLTFEEIPWQSEILERAHSLSLLASGVYVSDENNNRTQVTLAMVGGPWWFAEKLNNCLRAKGIRPVCSFSPSVSEHRHKGWIEA